eukprot:7857772-Pyramimonas_sp.AAC.1
MLDADVSVLPDGHAECSAMAPVVVVATSGWECSNRQYWHAMDPVGLRGGEGRNVPVGHRSQFHCGRTVGSHAGVP